MRNLYKFFWDYGRQGEVMGLFIADETSVSALLGKKVYFGEILGKHSEVSGTITAEDIAVIPLTEQALDELASAFGRDSIVGYNPLDYCVEEAL